MKNKLLGLLKNRKVILAACIALLVIAAAFGTTFALLHKQTGGVINTFKGTKTNVAVDEAFNGTVKKNVTAKNTGNTPAFVRIKLTSYRVNDAGERIGGLAEVPSFGTFGADSGWLDAGNDIFIYSKPVAPGESAPYLIGNGGINLKTYTDDDGGKQVIEVVAECIPAANVDMITEGWGVYLDDGELALK